MMNKLSAGDGSASRRINSWVDPSFSNLSETSLFQSGRRTLNPFSIPEEKRSRRKKKEGSSSPLLTEFNQGDEDEAWVDRYSPRSQAELAVHKRKIEEVENWMRVHANASEAGVLILTGPPGCGKTATVRVLSLEMGIRVQEWTNTSSQEPYSSGHQEDWWMTGSFRSSQVAQFQEFLLRANKYRSLKMAGDEEASDRKLILVEDFPNQFYREPCSLHDVLRRFVRTSQCSLVLIVSDSSSGSNRLQSLLPREVQEELHINCISFNPVAPTAMMKVLNSILSQETRKSCGRMCVPSQTEVDSLCSGSSGDVRSAVHSLQFLCLPEKGVSRMKKRPVAQQEKAGFRPKHRKKNAKPAVEQEKQQGIGGKDASLFLFRALGKILHCKRGNKDAVDETTGAPEPGLPFHLWHHAREALLVNPELVIERSQMSGEMFSLYLHQNYLDFFSDLEDVDRASEYLSDADLLTADWTNRSILGCYGSSVATRGLLHSNSHQVPSGFRPLHKPSWLQVSKKHRVNCVDAQSLFRSFCLSPVSLQTQLLPHLVQLSNPMRNQEQITFVQEVGQMSLKRNPGRLKPEALTDKEVGQQEEDEQEDEGGQTAAQNSLEGSQPEPSTNRVLLREEDLNIEDYISD